MTFSFGTYLQQWHTSIWKCQWYGYETDLNVLSTISGSQWCEFVFIITTCFEKIKIHPHLLAFSYYASSLKDRFYDTALISWKYRYVIIIIRNNLALFSEIADFWDEQMDSFLLTVLNTMCCEKTTEWKLLIQNVNLWHGTAKKQVCGMQFYFTNMPTTCHSILLAHLNYYLGIYSDIGNRIWLNGRDV